jgi:hypothetical protein
MNHTPGLLGATVRGARWGLPWLSMLAISASVAYAITVAAAGPPPAGDAPTTISAAQAQAQALVTAATVGPFTATAAVDGAGTGEACDTTGGRLLYAGLNSWIPAETGPRCPDGIPSTP